MTAFYRVIRTLAWPLVRIVFRLKVVGVENVPKDEGIILCCNHTSMTDIAFLVVTCRRQIYFMGKEELFHNKILGAFFKAMGGFAVKRGSGGGEAIETGVNIIKDNKVMGIFPEGTRSKDGIPKNAKSGIAVIVSKTGAPVVPVSVYREGKLRLFCKATIRYGKPIPAQELAMKDDSRAELKRVAELIMSKIVKLWEMKF